MALINKLKAIADAIRSKTGKTDAISLDDMAVEVAAIEASGGGTDLMLAGGLTEITNDHVTTLRDYALYMHTKDLVSVHFPNVTSIGSYSLGSCNVLTEASMPKLLTVGSSSFNCCFALEHVDFPLLETIQSGGFGYCKALKSVYFPRVTTIAATAFSNCTALTTAILPSLVDMKQQVFQKCTALKVVDMWGSPLSNSAFSGCTSLTALIIRSSSAVDLKSSNVFTSTPIASGTGYIYVPAALVGTYKNRTYWSTYAAQFRALESYTIDGTVTGALDESKI